MRELGLSAGEAELLLRLARTRGGPEVLDGLSGPLHDALGGMREAAALLEDFQGMITGKTPEAETPKALGDLRLLSGVRKFPQRVKCATLGWHALRGALAESGAGKVSLGAGDADL